MLLLELDDFVLRGRRLQAQLGQLARIALRAFPGRTIHAPPLLLQVDIGYGIGDFSGSGRISIAGRHVQELAAAALGHFHATGQDAPDKLALSIRVGVGRSAVRGPR